ncbi:hypothetical protein POX_e06436 [Penicillium oxalicum]|uniref:hypothetical protein n=1 Tax=Penicillium oxalicum TaxID=69781 RepID=UPI0020B643BE|nr:hypothetical protein POX_e06436 [Penicillium oxalicum]KAI2788420.1 hypothetical protein POX_e06436 [Penicillium oxalicum]
MSQARDAAGCVPHEVYTLDFGQYPQLRILVIFYGLVGQCPPRTLLVTAKPSTDYSQR